MWRSPGIALLLLLSLIPAVAWSTEIHRADHIWQDEDLLLARMDLDLNLPDLLLEALANGVGVDFRTEVQLEHPRRGFGESTIAQASRRVRLEYYALSRHYVITDLDYRIVELAPTLGDGLDALERRLGRVVLQIDPGTIRPGLRYSLAARVLLDHSTLPLPLQWDARLRRIYVTQLGWHRWSLQ